MSLAQHEQRVEVEGQTSLGPSRSIVVRYGGSVLILPTYARACPFLRASPSLPSAIPSCDDGQPAHDLVDTFKVATSADSFAHASILSLPTGVPATRQSVTDRHRVRN